MKTTTKFAIAFLGMIYITLLYHLPKEEPFYKTTFGIYSLLAVWLAFAIVAIISFRKKKKDN